MKRIAGFAMLCICLLQGCSRGLDPDADSAEAAKALQTALEAWKNGQSPDELEQGKPSIIMNEDDWRVGKRLVDYKVEKSFLSGRQIRARVQIKVKDKDGKMQEKKAVYIIDTTPRIVIVRDMFSS